MKHWTDFAEHDVYGDDTTRYVDYYSMTVELPSESASDADWNVYLESAYVDPMEWEEVNVCHSDPVSAARALCGCGGYPYP